MLLSAGTAVYCGSAIWGSMMAIGNAGGSGDAIGMGSAMATGSIVGGISSGIMAGLLGGVRGVVGGACFGTGCYAGNQLGKILLMNKHYRPIATFLGGTAAGCVMGALIIPSMVLSVATTFFARRAVAKLPKIVKPQQIEIPKQTEL